MTRKYLFLTLALLTIVLVSSLVGLSEGRGVGLSSHRGGGVPVSFQWSAPAQLYNNYTPGTVSGDTWYTTWGDDNNIYLTSNDSDIGLGHMQFMVVSTLSGWTFPSARATIVPPNDLAFWGSLPTSDHDTFKSAGLLCIKPDGVNPKLYFVTRRYDNATSTYFKDIQIIKSADHGQSWSPRPTGTNVPYASPMWPGYIGASGFFQYGQCYSGGGLGVHRSSEFVYAGIYNSNYTGAEDESTWLGRVPVSSIDNLNAADWQYYTGGDGTLDTNWMSCPTANWPTCLSSAQKIIYPAGYTTSTYPVGLCCGNGFQWLPAYGLYVQIGVYATTATGFKALLGKKIDEPTLRSTIYYYTFLTAPAPWGPWQVAGQGILSSPLQSWNNVIQASMTSGGRTFVTTSNGPYTDAATYQLILRSAQGP